MKTYTLSIGRNIGTVPMQSQHWYDFRRAVLEAVADFAVEAEGTLYFDGVGTGVFQGVSEQSYTLVFGGRPLKTPGYGTRSGALDRLKFALEVERKRFGQESVALTIGETLFI